MKKSTKVFRCSDLSQNVYGFHVNTAGIKLDAFLENPVCLLNHNYDIILGHWEDVVINGNALQGVPVFDTEDPEANKYYGQVERGFLRGASIGILPLAVTGDTITSSELLEITITPVPANRNALVMYNTSGVALNTDEARDFVLSITDSKTSTDGDFKRILLLIDNGINNNILSAENRSKWVELAKMEPLVALSVLSSLIDGNISVLSSEISNLDIKNSLQCKYQNWTFDDYSKQDPVALAAMQVNNPNRFMDLYNQKVKELRIRYNIAL